MKNVAYFTLAFLGLLLFTYLSIFPAKHFFAYLDQKEITPQISEITEKKMTPVNTFSEAVARVENLPEIMRFKKLFTDNGKGPVTGGIPVIEVSDENQAFYTVEVYEYIDGSKDGWERTPSEGTFFVNKKTGEVTKEIDPELK